MGNSSLVNYTKISPNKTVMSNKKNDTITIHCMAGQLSVETCGQVFADSSRKASSNYGIGPDGRVGLYVEEKDRSWCSSNAANDMRAVTIEVASDKTSPYAVTDAAYKKLIELVADICKRNGIKKLLWQNNPALIGQVDKQNMTLHRWFAAKACPGDYLVSKHPDIVEKVNNILNPPAPAPAPGGETVNMVVKIIKDTVNIRTGPGTTYPKVGQVKKDEVYTIVELSGDWGKLKSGAGWIRVDEKRVQKISVSGYVIGNRYTLQKELKVRTGPGTSYPAKKHEELTEAGKKKDKDGDGALDAGTKILCKDATVTNGDVWIMCGTGWLRGKNKDKFNIK